MTGPFASFDDYDFRHWVGVQASLGDAFSIHRLFGLRARGGSNGWFAARDTRNELAGYVADLDIARSHVDTAAATAASAQLVALQCRYALISGSIREVAAQHLPPLAARYVRAGLWPRDQALAWARISLDPAQALATVREALRDEAGDRQGELAQLAISTGASILDSDNRVLAVADLAGDLPPHIVRDALAIVAREANEGSRLGGLRRILRKLPDTVRGEALEIAKAFSDPFIRAEAILSVAEALEEPARTMEIDAVLESLCRAGRPRPYPSSDMGWRGVARALPLDRVREFLDFVTEDEGSIAWSVVSECLDRLAPGDPDWVLEQLKQSPRWVLDHVLDPVALALARRGRHAEAAAELKRISSSVLPAGTLAQLLMLAPAGGREPLLTIFSRLSVSGQVVVLEAVAPKPASSELLRLLLGRAEKGENSLTVRSAVAPVATEAEIDELLTDALASEETSVIARIAPHLSATQVRRALDSVGEQREAFKALVIRLGALGEHDEALRRVREHTDILEFDRATMLAELAAHLPDDKLRAVKAAARPMGLARERALARCALVPWLPASTVDEIVDEVLRLKPFDRIAVLGDLVERITPDRLAALGDALATALEDVLESTRYDRNVLESGFRALSGVLGRVASSGLEERALSLARSNRMSPAGHVLMLVQLAAVGGESSHAIRALALAVDIAGDDDELVAAIASGVTSAHAKTLAAAMRQDVSAAALATELPGDAPLAPDVERVFDGLAHLPTAKRAAEIADIAAWLDSTQIDRALECLVENAPGWKPALTALLQRSAILGDLGLIEKITNGVDNPDVLVDLIRDVAPHLPAAALRLALDHAGDSDSATAAVAVRAARLGEAELLRSALDRITWANDMDAIEQIYRFVPEHLLEMLIARAEAARPGERARALAEVAPRVADDRRQAFVEKVVRDSFALRVAQNPHRLRILRTLETELSKLPAQALAALWAEAMREDVNWAREETMVNIRGFARPLVAHFGPSVAPGLDDAIQAGGRDEWP